MTETIDTTAAKKKAGGLNSMLLADLKAMAVAMGIPGASSMKKAQLVEAIKAAGTPVKKSADKPADKQSDKPADKPTDGPAEKSAEKPDQQERRADRAERSDDQAGEKPSRRQDQPAERAEKTDHADQAEKTEPRSDHGDQHGEEGGSRRNRRRRGRDRQTGQQDGTRQHDGQPKQEQRPQEQRQQDGGRQDQQQHRQDQQHRQPGGRNREPDTTILEDDVLVPAAGILDVLDNYAFVRTSGYLPGTEDVYLSLSMVRKFGLRRGDAIVGQVRQPREGERREKFNPMVRIDAVNGGDPESAKDRPEFGKLTPIHPTERLRLETDSASLAGRMIDIAAPLGKGQRTLVVAPRDAGKTMLLQSLATAITANHPECHLMVVLVDERPEEVTDFQRMVRGEVIATTFDQQAVDHTTVAELAIERARRLVELGHDVVVLLDGLTRLGRAYGLAAASGRSTDPETLQAPKKFFGAARNIENGGSLTILATALVDTGSATDELIFEELQGTGNSEIRLQRELGDTDARPSIDPLLSVTRRAELLLAPQEAEALQKVRRLAGEKGSAWLVDKLRATQNNVAFLTSL